MKKKTFGYGISALVLLLVLFFCWLDRSVLIPFFLALLLAYFLDPAVDWVEARGRSRIVGVALVFGLFILVGACALGFLIPALSGELGVIQDALPGYAETLYNHIPRKLLELFGLSGGADVHSLLGKGLKAIRNLSFEVVNQVAVFLSRAFTSTLGFIVAVLGYLIIPVYLFYLLLDFDRLKDDALSLVPLAHRDRLTGLLRQIDSVLSAFIRGQLCVCLTLAGLYSLGLMIIGIDLAMIIGIFSGLAFIIPYLGTILGAVVAGTMAAIKFNDLLHPLLVLGLFGSVQALEGLVITPRLVGDRVGLHPMVTILAVLTGGELFGFFGLLLAVPVAASCNVILRALIVRYRSSDFFLSEPAEDGDEND